MRCYIIGAIGALGMLAIILHAAKQSHPYQQQQQHNQQQSHDTHQISVAFVGNSMFYFNDFPRTMEEISQHQITQNSCLRGGASITSLLMEGNGMYPQFMTDSAGIEEDADDDDDDDDSDDSNDNDDHIDKNNNNLYDFGACTVPQMLLGRDERLHDPGYVQPSEQTQTSGHNKNPCREDSNYLAYEIDNLYGSATPAKTNWSFVLINDNTLNPSRAATRAKGLLTLETFYADYFLKSGATPVFLWTHAYIVETTAQRNMTGFGLTDVANFTSLTYVGYKAYVDMLQSYLPDSQQPRIAPSGLAFLAVFEQDRDLWEALFHNADHLHPSPSGTFLQGCIVYHTLTGRMPQKAHVIRDDMSSLWRRARMMQHSWEPSNPYPSRETAEYLYRVAERIMDEGYVPKSFIDYRNGEVAYEG
jgi:hypothetical protein